MVLNLLWSSTPTAQVAMKRAEEKLIAFAHQFGNDNENENKCTIEVLDTPIPSNVIPFAQNAKVDDELFIHGVLVTSSTTTSTTTTITKSQTPLVLLHGYANGGLYFYRNLQGLSRYFDRVYSLDWLGWGLSSRPPFHQLQTPTTTKIAETFFVAALEAWRRYHNIDTMILAGHSIGGYLSVAYCEQYPHRVERLILLSPAGVTEETPEHAARVEAFRQRQSSSWLGRAAMAVVPRLFDYGTTPCGVLRTVPRSTGSGWVHGYVLRRLPAIADPDEQAAIAEYLYTNAILPGSGEYALNRLLTIVAQGQDPTCRRIPHLDVAHVTFLYGAHDWMDLDGGLSVEHASSAKTQQSVSVYQIPKAGHLLMLDNWKAVNHAIVLGAGLVPHPEDHPDLLPQRVRPTPTTTMKDAGMVALDAATTTTTTIVESATTARPGAVAVQA